MSNHALFQDVIRKRRSVRKFEPRPNVDRDILRRIVDCGRWAPSGTNVQCWDLIVVDDPIVRDRGMDVLLRQAQRPSTPGRTGMRCSESGKTLLQATRGFLGLRERSKR
jgi:nitroreductase